MTKTPSSNDQPFIDQGDQEISDNQLHLISGGATTGTAGGGKTSTWASIKSLFFGVDASFYD